MDTTNWSDVIEAAAKSPLGVLALMCLILATLVNPLTRGSPPHHRLGVLIVLIVGVFAFGYGAIAEGRNDMQEPDEGDSGPRRDTVQPRGSGTLTRESEPPLPPIIPREGIKIDVLKYRNEGGIPYSARI